MAVNLKVFHKGLILVGVPLAIELLLIASLSYLLYQSEQERQKEAIYRRGAVVMARLVALVGELPFLMVAGIEFHSERLFRAYELNVEKIKEHSLEIKKIRKACPEIKEEFGSDLQDGRAEVLAITARMFEKRNSPFVAEHLLRASRDLIAVSSKHSGKMKEMRRHGVTETGRTIAKLELLRRRESDILKYGLLANLLAGLSLAAFYQKSILRRIWIITANTRALAGSTSMSSRLAGADEIASLDKSFHLMQEQLASASQRERSLFENASDVIFVLDESMQFLKINKVCKLHWGYEAEALLGKNLEILFSEQDNSPMQETLLALKENPQAIRRDCKVICADGSSKEMLWSFFWSSAEKKFFGIVHDISEEKEVQRAKAQFLSIFSSDLQMPLAAISKCLTELLSSAPGKLPEEAARKLSGASSNVKRLVSLVDDLLNVASMQTGKLQIQKSDTKLISLVKQSLQDLEGFAQEKQVRLETGEIDESLNCNLDRDRIIQVLVNLLSNAVKFSPANALVLVEAVKLEDSLELRVIDRGRGVPESHRDSIFQKFSQVEISDGKRRSGTGLGLPICKQIIEEHGGAIGVRSNPEGGSIFWFSIPFSPAEKQELQVENLASERNLASVQNEIISSAQAQLSNQMVGKNLFSSVFESFSLSAKGFLLVALPLACELALAFLLFGILAQVDKERDNELHERLISNKANAWTLSAIDAFSGLAQDPSCKQYESILRDTESAKSARKDLWDLLKGRSKERAYLVKANEAFGKIENAVEEAKTSLDEGRSVFLSYTERHELAPTVLKLFHNLNKIIDLAEEKESAAPLKQKQLRQEQSLVLFLGLLANVFSSLFLASYFSKDINARLMLLADNSKRLADDKELNPPLTGADEIASLDKVFHETAAALSEARKKERAIFDNSQDIILVLSKDGRFLSVNPACFKLWSYTKEELLNGKILQDICFAEDIDESVNTILKAENEDSFVFQNRIVASDGRIVHSAWSVRHMKDDPLVYCVVRDISARKELEAMKSEFLSMVSHDLRTPITAIFGISQLAVAGAFGQIEEKDRELLKSISESCRGLVDLISDLLDLEKLEAGRLQLSCQEVEIMDLLDKVKSHMARPDLLKIEYSPELDCSSLNADAERLSGAICAVINYASSLSSETLRLRFTAKPGKTMAELKLSQQGISLSKEQASELFSRYKGKADIQMNGRAALSLALAEKVIDGHGGKISVSPLETEKSGNLFVICLPAENSAEDDD